MKSISTTLTCLLFLFSSVSSTAQITTSSQWTWMKGDNTVSASGVYGTQGVAAAANKPGARDGSVTWTDAAGNFWLFGGDNNGLFNDLWKYNPSTNQWTWINGSNTTGQLGTYGTIGTPAAANKPGGRRDAVSWTDAAGNFWLFGGYGNTTSNTRGLLNDLWKYNPSTNQWTWVNGSNIPNRSPVYGTLGIPAASNQPGARFFSVVWADASGNLWLFGGGGIDNSHEYYDYFPLNDLWKYNPATNQWTWINGDNTPSQSGNYGTMGTPAAANKPGARQNSTTGTDAAGNFWLFGGYGYAASSNIGELSDLWKYNPTNNQWTWIDGANTTDQLGTYGTLGTPAASNQPGARQNSTTGTDAAGNLFLFGGYGYATSSVGFLNDLWKYNPSTNQWTWINGNNTPDQLGTYGTLGTPAVASKPGGRQKSASWTDATGNFWLFGGSGYASSGSSGSLNDLWKFGTTLVLPNLTINDVSYNEGNSGSTTYSFTVSLSTPAPAGGVTFDIATANNTAVAGSDYVAKSLTTQTIAAGSSTYTFNVSVNGDAIVEPDETFSVNVTNATNAIITDGEGLGTIVNDDFSNDLITTASVWTWMKGDNTANAPSIYGTQGAASAANKPGGRLGSVSWRDASDNVWVFGGNNSNSERLNDLWKYTSSTNEWTWVKGDNTVNQRGIYGTQGVAAAANKPGARAYSIAWTDESGNFWLFGGNGYAVNTSNWQLNDLWKYTPSINQWTWVKGDSTVLQPGVYGTLGTAAAANKPGAREGSTAWNDNNGNLWLHGGYGVASISSTGYLNDLWKYNIATNQWTWINGANTANQPGTYGTQGIPASANRPGARQGSVSWTDAGGNLWLFGGTYSAGSSSYSNFSDLWKYTPSTNQWTWVKGDNTVNQPGIYGIQGMPDAANKPGVRYKSTTWVDNTGNLWLFGGMYFIYNNPVVSYLNDLWKYNPATNQWTWVKGDSTVNQQGVYGIQGALAAAYKPGARASNVAWADTSGNFWLFGGYGYPANGLGLLNDIWKLSLPQPNLTANDVSHNEGNGGNITYSFTVSLSTPAPAGGVTFDIATADGTATAGSDYVSRSLTGQTIAAGNSTYTFDVQVNGDVILEPDETFFVNVTNVTGAVITDGQGRGTIVNDEAVTDSITTTSQWTWMKGSNVVNAPGVYGSKGVASSANTPGTRYGSISWTDAGGNFWLFGGRTFIGSNNPTLNDLWKYMPSTNQWTWINGDSTGNQAGVYGVQGTPAATNKPGARYFGVSWTDAAGNLWLFGGLTSNSSYLNDLWKYNIATDQWIWVNGTSTTNQTGVYGTSGVAAATNRPGARYNSTTWTDASGNFWLFGGYGSASNSNSGSLNDLWKYSPATNQWTWMHGANSTGQPGISGIYGTIGSPAPANVPGARFYAVSWIDAADNLWLFGGLTSNSSFLNDLWKYDPNTNQWAWMKGDSAVNQKGIYGTLGMAATGNKPGARYSGITWTDITGNFWLLGGFGYDYTSAGSNYLNDLWKYSPATNQWAWINGSNSGGQPGVFGTQGVPATVNRPGARAYSNSWKDTSGNFWIFSGSGLSVSSDLWRLGNTGVSFISANDGNWDNPSTWVGGIVPAAGSVVVVRNNVTVQANASCYSLRIEGPNGNVIVKTGVQFTVLH